MGQTPYGFIFITMHQTLRKIAIIINRWKLLMGYKMIIYGTWTCINDYSVKKNMKAQRNHNEMFIKREFSKCWLFTGHDMIVRNESDASDGPE